ncbi:hypothetical protein DMB44_06180 [Thermoplasma sp. Kam2015]|nr:hypothetical protein DMB44_06180 [Thermoplasma sp. Kam2015]
MIEYLNKIFFKREVGVLGKAVNLNLFGHEMHGLQTIWGFNEKCAILIRMQLTQFEYMLWQ